MMDGIAKFEVSRAGQPSSPVATRLLRALDGEYVAEVLREQIEAQGWNRTAPEAMALRRLHDRGSHGFVIEYDATLKDDAGTRSEILFGELPHTQPAATMARALRRISRNFATESSSVDVTSNFILLDRLGLIIRPKGFDERIGGLRLLWQEEARRDTGVLNGLRPRLLTHRLGKRAVLRFDSEADDATDANSIIAKVYSRRSKNWFRSAQIGQYLRENGFREPSNVATVRNLDLLENERADVMAIAHGRSLSEMPKEIAQEGYRLAGLALARMHSVAAPTFLEVYETADELSILEQWIARIAALDLPQADAFIAAFATVRHLLAGSRRHAACLIHRDFHEGQLIVGKDVAHLIDFDTARIGDPAIDFGNFLAHLRFREISRHEDLSSHRLSFEVGYAAARRPPPADEIACSFRAALLRIACIYVFNDRCRAFIPDLLRQVETE